MGPPGRLSLFGKRFQLWAPAVGAYSTAHFISWAHHDMKPTPFVVRIEEPLASIDHPSPTPIILEGLEQKRSSLAAASLARLFSNYWVFLLCGLPHLDLLAGYN